MSFALYPLQIELLSRALLITVVLVAALVTLLYTMVRRTPVKVH